MDQTHNRILIFSLPGKSYGIDLSLIAEIIDPLPLYPVPRTPPFFRGIMQVHGSLIPVLDLAAYLGQGDLSDQGQLLVLTPGVGSLALWVAAVERIAQAETLSPREETTGLFPSQARLEQGEVDLLDVALLVERLAAVVAKG